MSIKVIFSFYIIDGLLGFNWDDEYKYCIKLEWVFDEVVDCKLGYSIEERK